MQIVQEPPFIEMLGGVIIDTHTGTEVLRINVDEMTIDEAARVRNAVFAGLNAEFMGHGKMPLVFGAPLPTKKR